MLKDKVYRFKSGQKALVKEGATIDKDWVTVILTFRSGRMLKETFMTDNVVLNLMAGIRWMKKNWNSDCMNISMDRIVKK